MWLQTTQVFIFHHDYVKPIQRKAYFRPSAGNCECRQFYDGSEDMLLPIGTFRIQGNKPLYLFTYTVMNKYTMTWCESGMTMDAYRRGWIRSMKREYNYDLKLNKKLWQLAVKVYWNEVLNVDMKKKNLDVKMKVTSHLL